MGGKKVVLSVNAGSSSLKVAVFDTQNPKEPLASLSLENVDSMNRAVNDLLAKLSTELNIEADSIEAIGHRVVHGGQEYLAPTAVTTGLIEYLERHVDLAPNHTPNILIALTSFLRQYPNTKQVACFDTSFFRDIPKVAQILPLPLELQRELGMRRYGFHGLSYQSLLNSFREHEGEAAYHGRVIMAHLGSGASVAACKGGRPLDMTMGFTPVSGVMMSTRSGDIEPSALDYIRDKKELTNKAMTELVTKQSGLLGVSGMSADMYTLLQSQQSNPDARLAIDLFCSKIQKTIGGFMTVLGGVDSIIFTAGIGERSAEIRARICAGLEFAGVVVDDDRNHRGDRLVSADSSRVGVHVIPAEEEQTIVEQTLTVIRKDTK